MKPETNHTARTSTNKREGQAGFGEVVVVLDVGGVVVVEDEERRGGFGRFEGGEVERAGLAWVDAVECKLSTSIHFSLFSKKRRI